MAEVCKVALLRQYPLTVDQSTRLGLEVVVMPHDSAKERL
jgi:hypothetical protein